MWPTKFLLVAAAGVTTLASSASNTANFIFGSGCRVDEVGEEAAEHGAHDRASRRRRRAVVGLVALRLADAEDDEDERVEDARLHGAEHEAELDDIGREDGAHHGQTEAEVVRVGCHQREHARRELYATLLPVLGLGLDVAERAADGDEPELADGDRANELERHGGEVKRRN